MEVIEYLKDPLLVANIQKAFGVRLAHENGTKREETGEQKSQSVKYVITNKLWYWVFVIGTALGDEVFYSCFIPFWFWNVDGAVGRRVVLVWTLVMYIGQGLKDIIQWERPGYPIVKLQSKWALEYGMPSTHAMVGISIPFSVLLYTMGRYQYNVGVGLAIATAWCTIVCISRLYLGMHTVLDVIAGLLLAILLMIPLVPLVDRLDSYLLTSPTSPFLLLVLSILMIVYYPNSRKWTPTRGDTAMIVSVCVGLHIGAWLNYQLGTMRQPDLNPPYTIIWPSSLSLFSLFLRTVLGFLSVLLTRTIGKTISYRFFCTLLGENVADLKNSADSLHNKHKNFVELACKYFTCAMIGFNTLFLLPHLFRFLRIERATFYTEI